MDRVAWQKNNSCPTQENILLCTDNMNEYSDQLSGSINGWRTLADE